MSSHKNPTPRTAIPNTAFTSMCAEVGVGERETPSLPTINSLADQSKRNEEASAHEAPPKAVQLPDLVGQPGRPRAFKIPAAAWKDTHLDKSLPKYPVDWTAQSLLAGRAGADSRNQSRSAGTSLGREHNKGWFSWLACALLVVLTAPALSATEKREETRLFKALGWAHIGAQFGDLASTEYALNSGLAREGNPMMQNPAVRYTVKPVAAFGLNAATAKLYQTNPNAALWMRIALVAGYGYITAHNLRTAYP